MSFLKFAAAALDFGESKSIGFVVGDDASPSTGDAAIKTHIEARGYTVTYIDDDDVTGSESYDAFIISESCLSSKISNKFNSNTSGIINLEYLNWGDMYLASDYGTDTNETEWDLILDTHPIAGSLSNGLQTVFTSASSVRHTQNTSNLGGGSSVIFDSPDGTSRPSIFIYDTGDSMTTGTAPGRRVAMPIEHTQWSIMNSTAKGIFDRALDWCLGLI